MKTTTRIIAGLAGVLFGTLCLQPANRPIPTRAFSTSSISTSYSTLYPASITNRNQMRMEPDPRQSASLNPDQSSFSQQNPENTNFSQPNSDSQEANRSDSGSFCRKEKTTLASWRQKESETSKEGSAKADSQNEDLPDAGEQEPLTASRSAHVPEINTAAYLYAMAMNNHNAIQPRIRGLQDGNVYLHTLRTGFITPELTGTYSDQFLNDLRKGETRLYYKGKNKEADFSLSEIVSFYCSMPEGIRYYEVKDPSGTYLEIEEPEASLLYHKVKEADAGWNRYADYVEESAKLMPLYSSDRELVDQINDFICLNYSYKVTNSGMPVFLGTGKGQCWHYAKLFADLCNTVGIPAWKVESDTHAWDKVKVEGKIYTFDPTFNDTGNRWTAYSWRTDYNPKDKTQ